MFVPGALGSFSYTFSLDEDDVFALKGQLQNVSLVQLSKTGSGTIFSQSSSGPLPKIIDTGGALLPGSYQIFGTANNGGPSGLDDGVNFISRRGSVSDFQFSVQ